MSQLKDYINSISPIADKTFEEFSSIFRHRRLHKDEMFINTGDVAKKIGFLTEGIIRAFYRNDDGQEYNKHFFIPPCFIGGYASLITGQTNQINQQALTTCSILEANYSGLVQLYDKYPDLERFARMLAERFFVQKEQREIELVLLNANERYEILRSEFPELEQLVPQYHIASYLGITPTQLSRIRRALSKR